MKLSEYSVKKPITVLMSVLMLIMLGMFSLSKLSLELMPDMNLPYAAVITTYPGANPYEVEEEVTKPVESALQGVGNFKTINSTSSENFSIVIIEFSQSTNMDTAFLDMRERLDMLDLDDSVGSPSIMKFDPSMMPVMIVSVTREFNTTEDQELILTSEWVESELMSRFESIEGVANVDINGASDTVIELDLNVDSLQLYGLTEQGVLDTIEAQNIEGMIGIVPDGEIIRFLYMGSSIEGITELENTPITYDEEVIYLKDLVNEIKYVNKSTNSYNKVNGKDAVSIVFFQQSDTEITDVVNNIIEKLDESITNSGNDAEYQILMNQGDYIEQAVGSVTTNLLIGAVAAVMILFLFLKDLRPTIIVALSIPISIIGAFLLMYFSGISLNVISMGGLALGIGMLVDNSIVVIENIYRLLKEGKSREVAAIEGAKQVGVAITASTLTTIMVFFPVFFIDNIIVEVFRSMALTVTYSLLASLIIALTLVPSLSAKLLKEHKTEQKKGFVYIWYTKALKVALRFKAILLLAVLALLVGSVFFGTRLGFEMMPASDEGQVNITVEMQKGSTFDKTTAFTSFLVDQIDDIVEIDVLSAEVGGGMMFMGGSSDSSSITILLNDDRSRSSFEVADEIQEIVSRINFDNIDGVDSSDILNVSSSSSSQAMGGSLLFGQGANIEIIGDDLYDMETVANELVLLLEGIEGLKDVSNGISRSDDVVRIEVLKEEAIKYGLTERDIQTSIEIFYESLGFSLMDNTNTNLVIPVDGVRYDIALPTQDFDMTQVTASEFLSMIKVFDSETSVIVRKGLEDGIILYMPNIMYFDEAQTIANPSYNAEIPMGTLVLNSSLRIKDSVLYSITFAEIMAGNDIDIKLTDIAIKSVFEEVDPITIVDGSATGFASISRNGKSRVLTVSAGLENGYNQSLVTDEINEALDKYKETMNYDNLTVQVVDSLMDTIQELTIAVGVAILLVYMVMAIQFQSLVYPFIVLFTVPLAFTGAFMALIIFRLPISLPAMVGLIVLTGIIVNNGIVLIDYINQQRKRGMTVEDSLYSAGVTRLRPIFMTALTTSIALLPMALGFGEGSELLQPLAITSIGGLLYATVLTLFVVPAMYQVFTRDGQTK